MRHPHAPRTGRRLLLVAALSALLSLFATTAAQPSAGASAPTTKYWYGWVKKVLDGDTFSVDITGDNSAAWVSIRLAGIQAMETGTCHADTAGKRLAELTAGKRVRMSAYYADSTALGRPVRYIDVWIGGRWVDVNQALVREGRALWMNDGRETARVEGYFGVMQDAAARDVGMHDRDACGVGPQQGNQVLMWAVWNGAGKESTNPNAEYLRIQNLGSTPLDLSGWYLRRGTPEAYWPRKTFARGTTVPARGFITVYGGRGTDGNRNAWWYFQRSSAWMANPVRGDAGTYLDLHLFDPQGDLRQSAAHPCNAACTDARAKTVAVTAVDFSNAGHDLRKYPYGQSFDIAATGSTPVDLSGLAATTSYASTGNGVRYEFELPPGFTLQPGRVLRVHLGHGTNGWSGSAYHMWMQNDWGMLGSSGWVGLRDYGLNHVACRSWGGATCPVLVGR